MLSQVPWWLFPLLMCLVLTGIHGYLGIHVLKRKVIFVDLGHGPSPVVAGPRPARQTPSP